MAWVFDALHLDLKSNAIYYVTCTVVDGCLRKQKYTRFDWIVAIGSFLSVGHFACAVLSPNYRKLLHAKKNANFCPSRLSTTERKMTMYAHSPGILGFVLAARHLNVAMDPLGICVFFLGSHFGRVLFAPHKFNNGRRNLDTFVNCIEPLENICKALETNAIEKFMSENKFDDDACGEFVTDDDQTFLKRTLLRVGIVLNKEENLRKLQVLEHLEILPQDILQTVIKDYLMAKCDDDRWRIIQTIRNTLNDF